MMNISTQIISILFSFFFGILFSIFTTINYKFLFHKEQFFKMIFTIIYVIDMALLYFLIIKKINNGIVNSYFLLFIGFGFLIGTLKLSKYINKLKYRLRKCLISVKRNKN